MKKNKKEQVTDLIFYQYKNKIIMKYNEKKYIYFKKSLKCLSLLLLKYYCLISVYDLRLIIFYVFSGFIFRRN